MLKSFILNGNEEPTADQLIEIEEASKHPIVFDDDAPELSPAMIEAFKCSLAQKRKRDNKRNT